MTQKVNSKDFLLSQGFTTTAGVWLPPEGHRISIKEHYALNHLDEEFLWPELGDSIFKKREA